MANDLLVGFLTNGENYVDDLFIIRCSPSIEEFDLIDPDTLVWCKSQKVKRYCDLRQTEPQLRRVVAYAREIGVEVIEVP